MIRSFKNKESEDIYNNHDSKRARKICPKNLWGIVQRKLDMLNAAVILNDLKIPPGNNLEALKGDRKGLHSIRVNSQYRICFRFSEHGAEEVEVTDYH